MEREVFHYMKHDCALMPFNDDEVFESDLVENYEYVIPQVCTSFFRSIQCSKSQQSFFKHMYFMFSSAYQKWHSDSIPGFNQASQASHPFKV